MTELPQDSDITNGVVEGWLDGQDRTPLSSGSAATATLKALETEGTFSQIAASRLKPENEELFGYAVDRTLTAHRRAGVDVPRSAVEGRLTGAFAITRCVIEMALVGAATRKKYDRRFIVAADRESDEFKETDRILNTPEGRARVMGLVAIASEAIRSENLTDEDRQEEAELHSDYQNALKGITSTRFPNQGDREVQRRQLMVHIEARLRAKFALADIAGQEANVDALINNLLADEPTESVFTS